MAEPNTNAMVVAAIGLVGLVAALFLGANVLQGFNNATAFPTLAKTTNYVNTTKLVGAGDAWETVSQYFTFTKGAKFNDFNSMSLKINVSNETTAPAAGWVTTFTVNNQADATYTFNWNGTFNYTIKGAHLNKACNPTCTQIIAYRLSANQTVTNSTGTVSYTDFTDSGSAMNNVSYYGLAGVQDLSNWIPTVVVIFAGVLIIFFVMGGIGGSVMGRQGGR